MRIIIQNTSMQPIYEQVVDQIKQQIMDGSLVKEQALPSVRTLSKELRISALTVKKAYDCLEEEGFIITVHGKGSYVANANPEVLLEEQKKEVEQQMEQVIRLARSIGMKDEDVRELMNLVLEEL